MSHHRPIANLSPLAAFLAASLACAAPALAQDNFFDWLSGEPSPEQKRREQFKKNVPQAVQRNELPDLTPAEAPPPAAAPPQNGPASFDPSEPVPRDPDGRPSFGGPQEYNTGPAQQFDPLEARRRGYQATTPPPQTPSSQWQNPDRPSGNWNRNRQPPPSARAYPESNPGAGNQYNRGYQQPPPDRRMAAPQTPPSPRANQQRNFETRRPPPGDRYGPPRAQRRSASRAPSDPFSGMQVSELESMLSRIDLPPRSPALHKLWVDLITAQSRGSAKMSAVRADALNRTGLVKEAAAALNRAGDVSADPVIATLAARTAIGAGDKRQGCETARSLTSSVAAKMPRHLKGQVILIAGFCAAANGNKAAAEIAAGLASENGLQDHAGPDALKAIAKGRKPRVSPGQKVSLLDYRILQLSGSVDVSSAIPTASPALLAVLARDNRANPLTRLAAAEAAANFNAITVDELANMYRKAGSTARRPEFGGEGGANKRASLFASAMGERDLEAKARAIRAFLNESRRAGFYWAALQLMARPVAELPPNPRIAWFSETAIEASLAGGEYGQVQRWVNFASSTQSRLPLRHWLALADIAAPDAPAGRSANLKYVEDLARRGSFDPILLHRLVTVLDALSTQVHIPLWEAASRTTQPSTGHLPDTGVLSQLQDAAKTRDYARTVLLAMQTLGPKGAEGAHMIALGDSIRALKRAGLEKEARQLALEALFSAWPRLSNS